MIAIIMTREQQSYLANKDKTRVLSGGWDVSTDTAIS